MIRAFLSAPHNTPALTRAGAGAGAEVQCLPVKGTDQTNTTIIINIDFRILKNVLQPIHPKLLA